MAGPNCHCHNCVYSICDPEQWLRWIYHNEPILPRCANHPWFPGQLHDVPGTACRNYRRKPALPQGEAVRMIALADGSYAYVDALDYEWLNQWTWYAYDDGYPARYEKGRKVFMHRQLMQPPRGMVVDHIDGNRANNCRFNLRVCTRAENMRNTRKHRGASSQFKGVGYSKRHRKFYARIWADGTTQSLGLYDVETDAARAYDYAAVLHFGEYAHLNFPREWPPERRAQVHAVKGEGEKTTKIEGKKVRGSEGKKSKSAKPRATSDESRATKKKRKQPSGRTSVKKPRPQKQARTRTKGKN